jgi:hypothetical protein
VFNGISLCGWNGPRRLEGFIDNLIAKSAGVDEGVAKEHEISATAWKDRVEQAALVVYPRIGFGNTCTCERCKLGRKSFLLLPCFLEMHF